jgi:hypothetical protein
VMLLPDQLWQHHLDERINIEWLVHLKNRNWNFNRCQ